MIASVMLVTSSELDVAVLEVSVVLVAVVVVAVVVVGVVVVSESALSVVDFVLFEPLKVSTPVPVTLIKSVPLTTPDRS
jgi:hypothetical protein